MGRVRSSVWGVDAMFVIPHLKGNRRSLEGEKEVAGGAIWGR